MRQLSSVDLDKFFFPDGTIKLHPDDKEHRENTMLWHATYLFHRGIYSPSSIRLMLNFVADGNITGSRSHDNMVGVLTYLVCAKHLDDKTGFLKEYPWLRIELIQKIKEFKIKPDYDHPRDFLYIAMLQNRWWWWAGLPLWIFAFLVIFVYMAVRKYKYRGDSKVFKTDTEILYWIRLQLPKRYFVMHLTRPIIVPLLKLKYGELWVKRMMTEYYKEEQHPNRIYVRR